MSTATATTQAPVSAIEPLFALVSPEDGLGAFKGDQVVSMAGIGWAGYEELLKVRGDRSRPRLTYLDGDLLLMSPGHSHERDKDRFHLFVVEVARALRMPFRTAGSTTYRHREKEGGFEPDLSFYFANAPAVRNKQEINLEVDPAPDLAIEVVDSHSARAAIEVSRRLGVPEAWVCDEKGLTFRVLDETGRYIKSPGSRIFPLLTAEEIVDWVRRPEGDEDSDLEWLDALNRWIRETLVPRATKPAS